MFCMTRSSIKKIATVSVIFAVLIMSAAFEIRSQALAYGPCDEDTEKLCANDTHQETVKACLHKKVDQLSPDCKKFVQSKESDWQKVLDSWATVKSACKSELAKNCKDYLDQDDEKMKGTQVCLMTEAKSLSAECKKELNRHIHDFQPGIKEVR
jgi:hypothetical protein